MSTLQELQEEIAQASAALAYGKAKGIFRTHRELSRHKSLYFALCGDAVKIGVSSHPEARLTDLQTGAPGRLTLLASIPNAGHRENECHRRLSHLCIHGEWFRYTEEVDQLIKELS